MEKSRDQPHYFLYRLNIAQIILRAFSWGILETGFSFWPTIRAFSEESRRNSTERNEENQKQSPCMKKIKASYCFIFLTSFERDSAKPPATVGTLTILNGFLFRLAP